MFSSKVKCAHELVQASYSMLKQSADKVSENKNSQRLGQLSAIVDDQFDDEEEKVGGDAMSGSKQDNLLIPTATNTSSPGSSLKAIAALNSQRSETMKPPHQAALTTVSKAFGANKSPAKPSSRLSVLGKKVIAMQKISAQVTPMDQSEDDATLTDLKSHILVQRKLLDPALTDDFDEAWGLDRLGEFDRFFENKSVQDEILAAIKYARLTSAASIDNLKYASPTARGLEVLHTFILDLLGHHTPAAYIFRKKLDKDFTKLPVTSRTKKWISLGLVVAINTFMIIYTLMYGLKRGLQWQIALLYGCIFQLIVEVIFNETLECVWINYIVPSVVIPDIRKAYDVICECIDQICYQKMLAEAHYLDTTKYFFVSRKVADAYPDLPESIIIRNYHPYLPGLIAKKWQKSYQQHHHQHHRWTLYERWKHFQSRMVERGAKLLLTLGSCPFIVQRIIVRVMQPLLFQAIVVYFDYIQRSTALYVVSLFLFSLLTGRVLYSYLIYYIQSRKINPLQTLSLFRRAAVRQGVDKFDIESPKRSSNASKSARASDDSSCSSSDSQDSVSSTDSVDTYFVVTRNVPQSHEGIAGFVPSVKDSLVTSINSGKGSATNESSSDGSSWSSFDSSLQSRSASDDNY